MEFNATVDFAQNLKQAQEGKAKVDLVLRGGTTLSGVVGSVGEHYAVLTQLAGKEFYDALIRIEDIVCLQTRVRAK